MTRSSSAFSHADFFYLRIGDACIDYVVGNVHRECAHVHTRFPGGLHHSDFAAEYFALNCSIMSFALLDDYYRNLIRSC